MHRTRIMITGLLLSAAVSCPGQSNVLRNGSFEGSLKYWISNEGAKKYWEQGGGYGLTTNGPAVGEFCARITSGELRSTPFPLPAGKPATISLSLRSDEAGTATVRLVPSDRSGAQATGGKYGDEDGIGKAWKRITFTMTPESPGQGNWCLVLNGPKPLYVDGVSVVAGGTPSPAAVASTSPSRGEVSYVPRRKVEITADAVGLPGYTNNGNMLVRGTEVKIETAVSRPLPDTVHRSLFTDHFLLRWELLDYEGLPTAVAPIEKKIQLAAGKTVFESASLKLDHNGLLLARVSVLDATGNVIDQSDAPLTVLPFPKAATTPDLRERFGCSLRGPITTRNAQAIGFRWVRWDAAPMGWNEIQPDGPDQWRWVIPAREEESAEFMAKHGFAVNFVLYRDVPKWAAPEKQAKAVTPGPDAPFWAQPGTGVLPKDMPWPANDPRWQDLSLETSWDRYVKTTVQHYKDAAVVFEFANEPDHGWDAGLYAAMAIRTGRLIKQVNTNAFYLTNQIDPTIRDIQVNFVRQGGAKVVDGHSWHNYGASAMGNADVIKGIRRLFRTGGNPNVKVWFNEGGAFNNSSQDYAALILEPVRPPQLSQATVRSQAEMLTAGADKYIMFHIGYGGFPRSWWDWLYNGGTELWDDDGNPTAAVATWNVLIDQLGLSEPVERIKTETSMVYVFDDLRNKRGVAVAFATAGKTAAVNLTLTGLVARDVMGNDRELKAEGGKTKVELRADGCPVYLFAKSGMSGKELAGKIVRE